MQKIMCIGSKAFPGVNAVFENGRALGLWDKAFVEDVGRPNELLNYKMLVFGAYHQGYERLLRLPGIKKVILWTSSPGQTAFRERDILEYVFTLLRRDLIDELWFGSKDFAEVVRVEDNTHYFPYPVALDLISQYLPKDEISEDKRNHQVSLFSPDDPRKNLMVQYQGFLLAQRGDSKLILHSNVFQDQAQHFINNYGWLEKPEYYRVLANCRINLAVFPFESFAYSVVEAILAGAIPIVSQTVKDNLGLPDLVPLVRNVDSPVQVSEVINNLVAMSSGQVVALRKELQGAIKGLAKKNNTALSKFLDVRLGVQA